jgi:hypothetical protein
VIARLAKRHDFLRGEIERLAREAGDVHSEANLLEAALDILTELAQSDYLADFDFD